MPDLVTGGEALADLLRSEGCVLKSLKLGMLLCCVMCGVKEYVPTVYGVHNVNLSSRCWQKLRQLRFVNMAILTAYS
jgi:hypothetical protein